MRHVFLPNFFVFLLSFPSFSFIATKGSFPPSFLSPSLFYRVYLIPFFFLCCWAFRHVSAILFYGSWRIGRGFSFLFFLSSVFCLSVRLCHFFWRWSPLAIQSSVMILSPSDLKRSAAVVGFELQSNSALIRQQVVSAAVVILLSFLPFPAGGGVDFVWLSFILFFFFLRKWVRNGNETDRFSIGFNARIPFFFTALLAPPPLRMFHHISIHLISRVKGWKYFNWAGLQPTPNP